MLEQPATLFAGLLDCSIDRHACSYLLFEKFLQGSSFPIKILATHQVSHGEPIAHSILTPAIDSTLQEIVNESSAIL